MQLFRQEGELRQLLPFPAKLNEIGAAANQFSRDRYRPTRLDITQIEDGIEPSTRQSIHCTPAQSVNRPYEGRSSNVSEFINRSTKPVS